MFITIFSYPRCYPLSDALLTQRVSKITSEESTKFLLHISSYNGNQDVNSMFCLPLTDTVYTYVCQMDLFVCTLYVFQF